MKIEDCRPEVIQFTLLMERELRTNDHKPGWKNCDPYELFKHLQEEVREVDTALRKLEELTDNYPLDATDEARDAWAVQIREAYQSLGEESADVGNLAMMVLDATVGLDWFDQESLCAK